MKLKPIARLSVFIVFLSPFVSVAETYYYHPSASIELGAPYDSFFPSENVSANGIFQWSEEGFTQEEGVNEVSFNYSEIFTSSELSKVLSIDANAEASFAFGSGSTSVKYGDISTRSQNEIIVAITATREYKPKRRNGTVSLSALGKEHLKTAVESDKLHLWRKIAGSDIIVETTSGHSVSLFYRFTTANVSKLESLRASVSATWSSGTAGADIVKSAKAVDSTVSIEMDYYKSGGSEDLDVVQAILTEKSGDVATIKKALAVSLNSGTSENARILRFSTLQVGSMPEVVFGTAGEFQLLSDYYAETRRARLIHFDRMLTATHRLNLVQRLLDEKPNNLYVDNGRTKLIELKKELGSTVAAIKEEYSKYQSLDPAVGVVSTASGIEIPQLSPIAYFKPSFVMPSEWVMTSGSAPRGGWGNYNDGEFHDFYVEFYPKLEFVLPEFVQRIRLFRDNLPVATARRSDISEIIKDGGNFSPHYQSRHSSIKVYTWGANYMPGAFNDWKKAKADEEGKIKYTLEVTASDESKHYIDLGNYRNAGGKLISLENEKPLKEMIKTLE